MDKIERALKMILLARKKGRDCIELRAAVRILSEMEGSKPKELLDIGVVDAANKVFSTGHLQSLIREHDPALRQAQLRGMLECATLAKNLIDGYLCDQPKEPPRYVREGPPVQMKDVLLACGELNERERVAVQWVLGKINELPEPSRYVMSKDYEQLAALLMEHDEVEVFATSNMPKAPTSRMAAMSWPISIIKNRAGVSLFGGTETVEMIWYDDVTAKKIVEVCTLLNLEWIAVEPPKEQGAEPYAWTVSGTVCMYFGEDAESDARMEAKKIGGTAVAFPLFRQEQGAEPVDEERELADHYLYMGWLMARGDGPMTEDDVRDAFLHALKYARAHPSPTSREKAMEEAGDAMEKTLNRAWQDLEDWRRQGVALRGESEEGVQRGVLNCIPSDAGIQFTRKIMQECIVAMQQWTDAKSTK